MASLTRRFVLLAVILAVAGCAKSDPAGYGTEEYAVKSTFAGLQEALKARNSEFVLPLLDAESQAEARRAAQAVRDAFATATPEEKGEAERAFGLSEAELAALDANGFLKGKPFRDAYSKVARGTFERAAIRGDRATVTYRTPGGDRDELNFVRLGGGWKVSLPMPK